MYKYIERVLIYYIYNVFFINTKCTIKKIIVQNIRYIPISRLEYEDSNYHLVMEDIFLSSDNFLPNVMEAKVIFNFFFNIHLMIFVIIFANINTILILIMLIILSY